jgi:hypothetical protein
VLVTLFLSIVAITAWLMIPIIYGSYHWLRTRTRRDQLLSLFGRSTIVFTYLRARGLEIEPEEGESSREHLAKAREALQRTFDKEFWPEYGPKAFVMPVLFAWICTGLVVYLLLREISGHSLFATPLSSPVRFALVGAFLWTLSSLATSYTLMDLHPWSFLWMIYRYPLAIAAGVLLDHSVKQPISDIAAFLAGSLPFDRLYRTLQDQVPLLAQGPKEVSAPGLEKLQGLDSDSIEKLKQIGVATIQQLAYSDPMELLFRLNVPAKVLVDWVDQALLYIYVGDARVKLTVRGIRGAIEMGSLREQTGENVLAPIAAVLEIQIPELSTLIESFYLDNHVRTLWELWGESEFTELKSE